MHHLGRRVVPSGGLSLFSELLQFKGQEKIHCGFLRTARDRIADNIKVRYLHPVSRAGKFPLPISLNSAYSLERGVLVMMAHKAVSSQGDLAQILGGIETESGSNLLSLTAESPVLLIFLRHFGCSFCRKTISDIADLIPELKSRGVRPVFVHLGTPEIAKAHFDFYRIPEVERINDPRAVIYQSPAFGLGRSSPWLTLVNPLVLAGWLKGAIFKHGIGRIEGDGHQMPGIFLLKGTKIERRFVHRQISDEPPYRKLIA